MALVVPRQGSSTMCILSSSLLQEEARGARDLHGIIHTVPCLDECRSGLVGPMYLCPLLCTVPAVIKRGEQALPV